MNPFNNNKNKTTSSDRIAKLKAGIFDEPS